MNNKNLSRNISLDALRVIAMIMIVTLHYLGKGGMLNIVNIHHTSNIASWLLEALCIVAVNIYVLISSYFLVKSKFKIKKVLKLIVQVIFYTLIIYFIFVVLGYKKFSLDSLIDNIFPTLTSQYWFVTSYIALYIISPFLNILIENMTKNTHRKLIIIFIFIFSIWFSVMPFASNLDRTNGYGIIWFICLYFVGSYIRIYGTNNTKGYRYLICYLLITIIMAISKFILYYLHTRNILLEDYSFVYYNYNSITVFMSSVCLFIFFIKFKINNVVLKKIISFLSPLTFGVYLIHEHPLIREILYTKILRCKDYIFSRKYIFIAIISIFLVYIICSLIDYVRVQLFKVFPKIIYVIKAKLLKKTN